MLGAMLAVAAIAPSAAHAQAPAPVSWQPDPVIAAAGDIACAPNNPRYNEGFGTENSCRQQDTASLLDRGGYSAVLPLGDLVNGEDDSLAGFQAAYEPTWGRFRAISRPAIGNHEYDDLAGGDGLLGLLERGRCHRRAGRGAGARAGTRRTSEPGT